MMKRMKSEPVYVEGPAAWEGWRVSWRFPMMKRIEQHRKQAARTPPKRGPKPQKRAKASILTSSWRSL